MKCPHCTLELKYPHRAYFNAVNYLKACTVITECCGNAVRVIPRVQIEIVAAYVDEDDWGVPIGKALGEE